MNEVERLINRLMQLSMSLGVLCAVRSMLANMQVCKNTLDGIFTAEEVVAEKQMELYDQLMEVLGFADSTATRAGAEEDKERVEAGA